jgi:hypothetical protein
MALKRSSLPIAGRRGNDLIWKWDVSLCLRKGWMHSEWIQSDQIDTRKCHRGESAGDCERETWESEESSSILGSDCCSE